MEVCPFLEKYSALNNIYLFGAGSASSNLVKRLPKELNVLGFLDNDIQKIGKIIQGLQVYAPTTFRLKTAEHILISSSFKDEIKKQLIDLNFPKKKVRCLTMTEMKGPRFLHLKSQQIAQRLIMRFSELIKTTGAIPYLYGGTLLGFARERRILPWDYDIDFAILNTDFQRMDWGFVGQKIFSEFPSLKWKLSFSTISDETIENQHKVLATFLVRPRGLPPFSIDFFIFYELGDNIVLRHDSKSKYILPKIHFQDFETLDCSGGRVYLPKNYEIILEKCFGNWREVVENWDGNYSNKYC